MNKKQVILIAGIIFVIAIAFVIIFSIRDNKSSENKPSENNNSSNLKPVMEASSINEELKKVKGYDNLIMHEFDSPTRGVEKLYKIEVYVNNDYEQNTFLENFELMDAAIDKFFDEDFDKSFLKAELWQTEEASTDIEYDDISNIDADYNNPVPEYIWGQLKDRYYVQIDEAFINVWFSKYGFGTSAPSSADYSKVYSYISGKRQEDGEINFKDGKVKLSEMEDRVMAFLNNDFVLSVTDEVGFVIGDARIVKIGDYEGVCFKTRRIYKGVPFEYSSTLASGNIGSEEAGGLDFRDHFGGDRGEVSYAESTYPDSMLAFGQVSEKLVEKEEITEIISLDDAMGILSEKIGENSIYDVYGVELIYRNSLLEDAEDKPEGINNILVPKWKFITVNRNDDKYTLFYVDVVTGEITERFEYYYE